jgi:hypothetical protein
MDPADIGVKERVTSARPRETGCRASGFGLYSVGTQPRSKATMNRQLAQRLFAFLRRLRAAGRSNMYGAIPYLMRTFALDRETAFRVVCDWEDAQAAERSEPGEPRRPR